MRIFKRPKQNFEWHCIKIHSQFSGAEGALGPQVKFHKGPIEFSWAQGPKFQGPTGPCISLNFQIMERLQIL